MNNEQMFFLTGAKGDILVHAHIPEKALGKAFVFLNPIFDEKKRVHQFQAQTAREICKLGWHVFRFDYYGTGDSSGNGYEFEGDDIIPDLEYLKKHILEHHGVSCIAILGIRFGADIALKWMEHNADIKDAFIIEPVFNGAKYLLEQRTRRKLFQKINQMNSESNIKIGTDVYEDFQGFLVSQSMLKYIQSVNSSEIDLSGKNLYLYKLDNIFSAKNFNTLYDKHNTANTVNLITVPIQSFWDKLEVVNTKLLTQAVVDTLQGKYIPC